MIKKKKEGQYKENSDFESADMGFKAAILTMLKDLKENSFIMNEQMDNLSK